MTQQISGDSLLAILMLVHRTTCAELNQPNVVVFVADDLGWGDLTAYANELI